MNKQHLPVKDKPNLDRLLTIYGRKPVLEALRDGSLEHFRLHLADSNQPAEILDSITALANKRNIEIRSHTKQALSRISKNSQQDQGVALDIYLPRFTTHKLFFEGHRLDTTASPTQLLAIDGVTNPQNLGMIIRSVAASRFHGLILPNKGCAKLDALVIKASAGTLFRARIIRCDTLVDALKAAKENGFDIAILDAHSPSTLHQFHPVRPTIYVLGNESGGVSDEVRNLASHQLAIPMANQVESLNVAVTAGIVAFAPNLFATTKTGLE